MIKVSAMLGSLTASLLVRARGLGRGPSRTGRGFPFLSFASPPQFTGILLGGREEIKDGRSEEVSISIHIKKWGDHKL